MYSQTAKDHFLNPRNVGVLEDADGIGVEGTAGEGNHMVIALRIADGVIQAARFQTYGCPGAIVCGSYLTEWITGMPATEAAGIPAPDLEEQLGGLPLGKSHCAALAVAALRKALADAGMR